MYIDGCQYYGSTSAFVFWHMVGDVILALLVHKLHCTTGFNIGLDYKKSGRVFVDGIAHSFTNVIVPPKSPAVNVYNI